MGINRSEISWITDGQYEAHNMLSYSHKGRKHVLGIHDNLVGSYGKDKDQNKLSKTNGSV